MTTSEIATVLAWHDALTTADLDTLATLSGDDIEVGDAHGAGQGHQALRDWAARAGIGGELGRMFVHDGVVVVELPPEHPGEPVAAAAFRVVHDHVTSVFRHDSLPAALAATGLTEDDRTD